MTSESYPSSFWIRFCDAILVGASHLVPGDIRRDWRREWRAEIHHRASRGVMRNGHLTRRVGARCALRTVGAIVHALWLRWDRWRLEMLLQDIRYAFRGLIKRPGFAALTVLTLALGIGANAAIFSAVRAVLLRPLPFPEPDALVRLFSTRIDAPDRPSGTASAPDFVDWRHDNRSLTEVAAVNNDSFALTGVGEAEQVPGARVTGGFFHVFAVPALYGRTLALQDDLRGGEDVVVLSHALWTRRFGGDPGAIGRLVTIDGLARRIVGIMPRGFIYPERSELWMPMRFTERDLTTQRGAHYLDVVGRLRRGVTLEQARDDMRAIALRLAAAYPSTNRDYRISVHTMREAMVGDVKPALVMLLGAVGFLLLIVCVNVANLVLTRALGRTREMAVRGALGAGRGRLLRGVAVESLLLAFLGGTAGLLLAVWATQGIAALERGLTVPLLDETRVDRVVVMFTLAVSAAAAVLFGALPAWHTSSVVDVAQRIREDSGTATSDRQRHRLRAALIVAETALAVVLLVGAGLLLRSFVRLTSVELGFNAPQVQTFNISLPDAKYPTPNDRASFVETLLGRIASQPGVAATGAIFGLPLSNVAYSISMFTLDGRTLTDDEQDARSLQVRVATPDYFTAMGIPIVRGRALQPGDRHGSPHVVVINETAARDLWPGQDALGHEFTLGTRMGQGGERAGGTVVGIARDVRDFGPVARVRPTVYLAHAQFPMSFVTVTVRSTGDNDVPVAPLRRLVAELDTDLPIYRVRTMDQLSADAVAQPRAYVLLLSLFAGTAVLLAAIGIYGVLMHVVAQRTHEIGIRLALGAKRGEVIRMVVRQATSVAALGLLLGLAIAAAGGRLIRRLLFGIEPTDISTFALVAIGLFAIALLASYIPARRAARIDPVRALRCE